MAALRPGQGRHGPAARLAPDPRSAPVRCPSVDAFAWLIRLGRVACRYPSSGSDRGTRSCRPRPRRSRKGSLIYDPLLRGGVGAGTGGTHEVRHHPHRRRSAIHRRRSRRSCGRRSWASTRCGWRSTTPIADHYWPSPLIVLAGFGARTSRVLLGTDILVAPFYHPVRLAEDVGDGRYRCPAGGSSSGAAIGYKPDEFALYGAELERRGARSRSSSPSCRPLWTRDGSTHEGRFYTVRGPLEPKPVTVPHPPIWIGGWGDHHAAARGDPRRHLGAGPDRRACPAARAAAQFLDAESPGRRPRTLESRPWPLTRDVIIADTEQEARDLAEEHLMVTYRDEYAADWKHPLHRRGPTRHRPRGRSARTASSSATPTRRSGPSSPSSEQYGHRPPDLPPVLPGHAPRPHHVRDQAAREGGHAGVPLGRERPSAADAALRPAVRLVPGRPRARPAGRVHRRARAIASRTETGPLPARRRR